MSYKNRFPFFENNKDIIYLDSAASSQMLDTTLEKQMEVSSKFYSNIHRGIYKQSELCTDLYEYSRELVSKYINCLQKEIIWTTGTTDGLNLLANSYYNKLKLGDIVLLSKMEHHANLVPWQRLKEKGIILEFIDVNNGILNMDDFDIKIKNPNVKVLSITYASNVTGIINPIKDIIEKTKNYNIDTIIDAAQVASHHKINVKDLNCDYLVFSAHKCYGPNGVGVLYGKYEKLKELSLYRTGGDVVKDVTYESSTFQDPPYCFEAGTPNITGIISFSESIKFLDCINSSHSENLDFAELYEFLNNNKFSVIGEKENRVPIISIYHPDINLMDFSYFLSIHNICFRVGEHCAMPFIRENLKINGTLRFSFGIYNDKEDITSLIKVINKFIKRGK